MAILKIIKKYRMRKKLKNFIELLRKVDAKLTQKGLTRNQRRRFFQDLQTEEGRKYLIKILEDILEK